MLAFVLKKENRPEVAFGAGLSVVALAASADDCGEVAASAAAIARGW